VAESVFAYVQPDGGWCLNNAGVIVDGREVAVVDTVATEARARHFHATVMDLADASPRLLINTHFHGDHTFGNFVFAPQAVVIAQERTRNEMAAAGLGLQRLWPDVAWGAVRLTLPEVTFLDQMTLHIGNLRVELIHPGPAHTTADTVVWLPERSVLFAGDIVMNGVTPFCLMGSVTGSLRVIARLRELGARTVVPGHGPVGGPELFDETEAYLRWLRGRAIAGLQAGVTSLRAARDGGPGPFAHLLDSERLVANLHRAYAELRGTVPGARIDEYLAFQEMVEYHGGLPACHA
jgi:cyclase